MPGKRPSGVWTGCSAIVLRMRRGTATSPSPKRASARRWHRVKQREGGRKQARGQHSFITAWLWLRPGRFSARSATRQPHRALLRSSSASTVGQSGRGTRRRRRRSVDGARQALATRTDGRAVLGSRQLGSSLTEAEPSNLVVRRACGRRRRTWRQRGSRVWRRARCGLGAPPSVRPRSASAPPLAPRAPNALPAAGRTMPSSACTACSVRARRGTEPAPSAWPS